MHIASAFCAASESESKYLMEKSEAVMLLGLVTLAAQILEMQLAMYPSEELLYFASSAASTDVS